MGNFNFKSAGKTPQQKIVESIETSRVPISIKTPLSLNYGEDNEILVTHYTLLETVKDNLKNLLLTNWGERVGLYDFGANLQPILFNNKNNFDDVAVEQIRNAVARWMPYVSLNDYVSTADATGNRMRVQITFDVPNLGVIGQALEITVTNQ